MFEKFELNQSPIAYNPVFSKITGSVNAGILLSQLVYWYNMMQGKEFYKTNCQLANELGMTEMQVRKAKESLIKIKFVEVKLKGVPKKSFYEIKTKDISSAVTSNQLSCSEEPNELLPVTDCQVPSNLTLGSGEQANKNKQRITENNKFLCVDSNESPPRQEKVNKKKPPKPKTNPDVKTFIDFYFESWKTKFGEKPLIDGQTAKLVERLLATYGIDKLKSYYAKFLEIEDDDFISGTSRELNVFYKCIGKVIQRANSPSDSLEARRREILANWNN